MEQEGGREMKVGGDDGGGGGRDVGRLGSLVQPFPKLRHILASTASQWPRGKGQSDLELRGPARIKFGLTRRRQKNIPYFNLFVRSLPT